MSGEIIPWDIGARMERDRRVFDLRLRGRSELQCAEECRCSVEDVHAAIARMAGGMSEGMRQRMLMLVLARLEDLSDVYYQRAKTGEYEALAAILQITDRQCRVAGLNKGPADPSSMTEPSRRESQTQLLKSVIDRLVAPPTIDGEILPPAAEEESA
jgi:hypothetical protein